MYNVDDGLRVFGSQYCSTPVLHRVHGSPNELHKHSFVMESFDAWFVF